MQENCTDFYLFCLGNGYITTAVLREILKELDDKITNEDLDMMIEEIDSDGSGTVDFDGMERLFIDKIHCFPMVFLSFSFAEFMEVMTGGDD